MKKVYVIASFYLKSDDFLEDWKKLSDHINGELAKVDGFLSREVARSDDGKIFCILTWASRAQQEKFAQQFQEDQKNNPEKYAEFGRIVDFSTMKKEVLEVL